MVQAIDFSYVSMWRGGPKHHGAEFLLATKKHKKLKYLLLVFELFVLLCG
jgi:hypothetical protein